MNSAIFILLAGNPPEGNWESTFERALPGRRSLSEEGSRAATLIRLCKI